MSVREATETSADITIAVARYIQATIAAALKGALWRPPPKRCDQCGHKLKRLAQ